jgi:hypothetical protein
MTPPITTVSDGGQYDNTFVRVNGVWKADQSRVVFDTNISAELDGSGARPASRTSFICRMGLCGPLWLFTTRLRSNPTLRLVCNP